MTFVHFVNEVLMYQKSDTMEKFRLTWYKCQPLYVSIWISNAITRSVKVLDLNADSRGNYDGDDDDDPIRIPGSLFNSRTLENLRLKGNFLLKVPAGTVYLPKLGILDLEGMVYECFEDESDTESYDSVIYERESSQFFRKLIPSCPTVYSLSIEWSASENKLRDCVISSRSLRILRLVSDPESYDPVEGDGQLVIDAPALEHLVLRNSSFKKFSLQGLMSLKEVELHLRCWLGYNERPVVKRSNFIVKRVFRALNSAKIMKLSCETMVAFISATVKLSTEYHRLSELYIDFHRSWGCMLDGLKDLLECSVKLEFLRMTLESYTYDDAKCSQCWRKPKHVPKCLLYSLEQVSFCGFGGLNCDVELIRYILKHGLVMKRIKLHYDAAPNDFESRYRMVQKILMFPRASRSCQVEFSLDWLHCHVLLPESNRENYVYWM